MIRFQCTCGRRFKVEDRFAGKRTKCTQCGTVILIPFAETGDIAVEEEPGKPAQKSGNALSLESEQFGIGGKIGDEASTPATEGTEAPIELQESTTTATPAAPSELNACPKCGKAVDKSAKLCVHCGEHLVDEKTLKAASHGGYARQRKRTIMIVSAVAAILVIGAVVGIIFIIGRLRKSDEGGSTAGGSPTTTVARKALPPPSPPKYSVGWNGFAAPELAARDKLHENGLLLLAKIRRDGPPAKLGDAEIANADDYVYSGIVVAGSNRFCPLMWQAKPDRSGRVLAFFSDTSVRPVTEESLRQMLPKSTRNGLLTPADEAFLALTEPRIRVENNRLPSVQVLVDNKALGEVKHGQSRVFPMDVGTHQLTLTATAGQAVFSIEMKNATMAQLRLPRHGDLPLIPLRTYRATAAGGQQTGYTIERENGALAYLRSENDTVEFDRNTRNPLPNTERSIAGKIVRNEMTIEGLDGPILVSEINRLDDGRITMKDGREVRYHKTDIGPVTEESFPNTEPATVAIVPLPVLQQALMGGGGFSAQLSYPADSFSAEADIQTFSDELRARGRAASPLLLQRLRKSTEEMEIVNRPEPRRTTTVAQPGSMGRDPREVLPQLPPPPPPQMTGGFNPHQLSRLHGRGGLDPMGAMGTLPSFDLVPLKMDGQSLTVQQILAAIAVYGDQSALPILPTVAERLTPDSPGYAELLLALAQSGRGSALAELRSAASDAPVQCVLALVTLNDPAARKAVAEITSGWSAEEVAAVAAAWPKLAGPAERISFVEIVAQRNPALLEQVKVLNALMQLDAYALQRVIVASLVSTPAAETQPQVPTTPMGAMGDMSSGLDVMRLARLAESAGLDEEGSSPAPAAWQVVAHYKNPKAVAYFVEILKGRDNEKRLQAIAALSLIEDDSLTESFAALLDDSAVRVEAAKALAKIGTPNAVEALREQMSKDLLLSQIVKMTPQMAARAGKEPTANLLAAMLQQAVELAPPPVQQQEPPQNMDPRYADPRGVYGPPPPPPPPSPAQTQESSIGENIISALSSLGVSTPETEAALAAARSAANPALRIAVTRMASTSTKRAGSPLRGFMKITRLNALTGGSGSSSESDGNATAGLEDENAEVRAAALQALRQASAADAVPFLRTATMDESPVVRAAALDVAASIPGAAERMTSYIAVGLLDTNADVVAAAARAAIESADESLHAPLVEAINSPTPEGAMGPGALPDLIRAAGELKVEEASSALVLMLAHSYLEVQVEAARALGILRSPNSSHALLAVAQRGEPEVMAAALTSLSGFDTQDAAQATLKMLARTDMPEELRQPILSRLVSDAGGTGPYAEWAAKGPLLSAEDLQILVKLVPISPPNWRNGFVFIAQRHLSDTDLPLRTASAEILAQFSDVPQARELLITALTQNARGVAKPFAEMCRSIQDVKLIQPLSGIYQAVSVPGTASNRNSNLGGLPEEDRRAIRLAIISALGNMGGDEAARMLRSFAANESDTSVIVELIAAVERTGSSLAVGYIADFAKRPDASAIKAIDALTRMKINNVERVRDALMAIIRSSVTPPDVSAAAADALELLPGA